jgi:hypothetical protein
VELQTGSDEGRCLGASTLPLEEPRRGKTNLIVLGKSFQGVGQGFLFRGRGTSPVLRTCEKKEALRIFGTKTRQPSRGPPRLGKLPRADEKLSQEQIGELRISLNPARAAQRCPKMIDGRPC